MQYYIIKHRVQKFDTELSKDYNYQKLTSEQTAFYLLNPQASISEILNMQLNPVIEVEPTPAIPSETERIEALEDVVNLILAGDL